MLRRSLAKNFMSLCAKGIAYHVYDAALMLRFRSRLYRSLSPLSPSEQRIRISWPPRRPYTLGAKFFLQSLSMIIHYFHRFPKVVVELLTFITERGEI